MVNPGNPIAVSTSGSHAVCDVLFDGENIAQAVVSEGARGSTIGFVDGGVTARYGPGEYVFKFHGGSAPLVRVSARVNDYDDHAVTGDVLPELVGTHGWFVVHDEKPDPVVNLSVDASHNFWRVGLVIIGVSVVDLVAGLVIRFG